VKRAGTLLRRTLLVLGALTAALLVFGIVRVLFFGKTDEERIEGTIEAVVTRPDPSYCHTAMTDAYIEQITGVRRPFADEVCEASTPGRHADSVDVRAISVDGDRATATVTYTGGSLDGSTARVRLVKDDRRWKLDRRLGFPHFDRAGFRRAYRIVFSEFGSPGTAVRCALAHEARLTDSDIERGLLGAGPDAFTRIAVACDREGVERNVLGSIAATELDPAGTRCVERRLAAAPDARLADLEFDIPAYGRLVISCVPGAFVSYAHRKLVAEGNESPAEITCIVGAFRRMPPSSQLRLTYDEERYEALYDRCEAQAAA
jgi:hypothetical protein